MNLNKIGFSETARVWYFKIAFVVCIMVSAFFMQVEPGCSAAPKTPCDPEYMDALESRAWLEAEREIAQNQNLIFKPDSVLELTCFDYFLNEAASNFPENRQFSETDRWDGWPEGFSDVTTDIALTEVVFGPFASYLGANFLGDFGAYLNNRRFPDYTEVMMPAVDGGVSYGCNQMQMVWLQARCMNFNEQNDFDGFYDFAYYEEVNPRQEEAEWAMMCVDPDPRIAPARVSAFNEDQDLFNVEVEFLAPEGNGAPYLEDDIVTHLDLILPGGCNLCIPTGITVQRPDLGTYPEMVCTNPGCPAPGG